MDQAPPSPELRLVLLRHAKSEWPEGVPDLERPLADRGVADATAAGPRLAAVVEPDLVLCSPAVRTRRTYELVCAGLTAPPPPRIEPVVYGADVSQILALLNDVPAGVSTVLLVGHEPTLSQTALALSGPGSQPHDLDRLRRKYPTAGLAVLALTTGWVDLVGGSARLERFVTPKD